MTFPLYLDIGFAKLHPHPVFETLAYFVGFRFYLLTRSKGAMPASKAIWIIVAAILGAAAGSKLLYWLENPAETWTRWNDYAYMMGGKTIVGGLLGGLIAVEWAKKRVGVTRSTGDDMAVPLVVGIAIGRIGCFLAGLDDHTYGTPTGWPTAIDFGDGIPRHPTQLYEIVFLLLLGAGLSVLRRGARTGAWRLPDGALFQLFMAGYLLFRLAVDFVKPTPHPFAGLNNVQLACIAGLVYYAWLLRRCPAHASAAKESASPYAE
ncbi:prolipoprotein diacylglyceryl transferase [Paenibacillus flagellatus]|uniref:Diacylglyceryl transferase n=1 Tax=Paenibacillus flagellatus TaxID=2211139 RepID=A0A2V5JYK9_9BACL|nr:prolipoprotein diacylglyceryl transferase family protein [Paenibacillus flagellatus]PYI51801.1 diacylglyceryl transferase [Paenibacillus flagellatus]